VKLIKGENMSKTISGIGFTGVLQVIFIVLKLCKLIQWSWWVVLLPTIISTGLVVLACIVFILIEGIKSGSNKNR